MHRNYSFVIHVNFEHAWAEHNLNLTLILNLFFREPLSLCLWARHAHLLAVGTSKGNLLLYNHRTRRLFVIISFVRGVNVNIMFIRKVPVLGKHTKKITCGAWSNQVCVSY